MDIEGGIIRMKSLPKSYREVTWQPGKARTLFLTQGFNLQKSKTKEEGMGTSEKGKGD